MKYLVQGWHSCRFLISPDELSRILSEYHLVIFNAHVPADYTKSPLDEYIAAYSRLYDLLLSGEKIIWKRDYPLFLHRGITTDLSNCIYGNFHIYEGKQYKRAAFGEPVVGISPAALCLGIDENNKLHCSTSCSYSFYPEGYMGVSLDYPKMIQYPYGDGYEPLRTTETLRSYQDFIMLKDSVKKLTLPLSIKAAGNERRLNIRMSDEARGRLNDCYLFRQYGVIVK